ncbi:MAG: four helix bundle protein [bacterium]|nr:four helix bundle protein [bacterium]
MKNRFEDLQVWNKSHKLTLKIYRVANNFPRDEKYRLGDQLRRSSASVTTNIVEGNSRISKKEFRHFLDMARSSLEEAKYHLLLARDLGYLEVKIYLELQQDCEEIGRMLSGLLKSIKS